MNDRMSRFTAWIGQRWEAVLSPVTQRVLLAGGVVGVSLILANGFRDHAIDRSAEWTRNLPYSSVDSVPMPRQPTVGTTGENERLASQLFQIRARANLHLRVMRYFYARYFTSITMATVLAIGAAACLVHISAAGWRSANPYVATIFIVAAGLAIIFRASPLIYQQEENIEANKDLYTRYVALDNEVETFIATGRFHAQDSVDASTVIQKVDSVLFSLRELPIGFDRAGVPDYGEVQLIRPQE